MTILTFLVRKEKILAQNHFKAPFKDNNYSLSGGVLGCAPSRFCSQYAGGHT